MLTYIITTPSVCSRLKEEITSAIRDGIVSSPITFAQAKRLSYLQVSIQISSHPLALLINASINVGGDIRRHSDAYPSTRLMA